MKLGFDASSLSRDGKGLARFQGEFLSAMARMDLDMDVVVFVPRGIDERLLLRGPFKYVGVHCRPMLLWEQWGLPYLARREGVDLVISTSERIAMWGPRTAVYIYEHPKYRVRRQAEMRVAVRQRLVNWVTLRMFDMTIRRAAVVLAASRATAREVSRRDVHVVPSAAAPEFYPDEERQRATRAAMALPEGYLLHLASDDPRDNSVVVIQALAELRDRGLSPSLVVAGPIRDSLPRLQMLADDLGVEGQIRWMGFCSGPALADLYRGAIAYVDPSLYEGFGLQALEALSCGIPAVTSDVTSLPEVVGQGGILVAPTDVEAFADGIEILLTDVERVDRYRQDALEHSRAFSWEKTVRETLTACGVARAVTASQTKAEEVV